MRRFIAPVVLVILILALPVSCGVHVFLGVKHTLEQPPLRQFGEFGSSSPVATDFSPVFARRLGNKVMPAATSVKVSGDRIDFNKILFIMGGSLPDQSGSRKYSGAWREYLGRLRLPSLDTSLSGSPPHPILAMELKEGERAAQVCQSNQPTSADWTVQYCRVKAKNQKGNQTGLLVLPTGYTDRLQQWANEYGAQQQGWLAASIVAGVVYAQHLRPEVSGSSGAGYNWPTPHDHLRFDYCVAGISVRALFPPSYVEQAEVILSNAAMFGLSTQQVGQNTAFAYGMKTGRLSGCPSA